MRESSTAFALGTGLLSVSGGFLLSASLASASLLSAPLLSEFAGGSSAFAFAFAGMAAMGASASALISSEEAMPTPPLSLASASLTAGSVLVAGGWLLPCGAVAGDGSVGAGAGLGLAL